MKHNIRSIFYKNRLSKICFYRSFLGGLFLGELSFAKILKEGKNKFHESVKIAIMFFLAIFLFSCSFFQDKNSVSSNEDLGHSASLPEGDFVEGIFSKSIAQNATNFVYGSKDIPLAKGLSKNTDDEIDFDSASGSIVFVSYKSSLGLQKIKNFYLQTLPQLGWVNISNGNSAVDLLRFKRDNEKLEIEFVKRKNVNLVKFFAETVAK